MKIIGEINNGFIVSISNDETAKLTGYSSSYSNNYTKPKIGSEVDITELYKRLQAVENLHSALVNLKTSTSVIDKAVGTGLKLYEGVVKELT